MRSFLARYENLSETSIDALMLKWNEVKSYTRNDIISAMGTIEHRLYFVEEGMLRLYVEEGDTNKEANVGFAYENSMITSFSSFINQEPSKLSLQALTACKLRAISKSKLFQLMASDVTIASWYSHLLEKTLSGHINRQIELLTLSPKQRYHLFLERSGPLVNSIPLKHIASYLKMKPETLSRIRNENP